MDDFYNKLNNHVDNMKIELADLSDKINGFEYFIKSKYFKQNIHSYNMRLLTKLQLYVMKFYRNILFKRLQYFIKQS